MIRVFKTDMFRLFRSKAFYVFPVFLVVFMTLDLLFNAVTTQKTVEETGPETAVAQEENTEAQNGGTGFSTDVSAPENTVEITVSFEANGEENGSAYTDVSMKELLSSLTDGLMMLFMGIVLVIFVTCETRYGFVKTAAGCVKDRIYMPLSKIATGFVMMVVYAVEYAVIEFIFMLLASAFTGRSLRYVPVPEGEKGQFAVYILLCVLIHLAVTALLILLHELLYSRAAGIVFTVILATGLIDQLIMAVTNMLRSSFGLFKDFDITGYLLIKNLQDGYKTESYQSVTLFVISLIYLIGGTAAAVWVAKRKDIR